MITFVHKNKTISCVISQDNVHIINSARIRDVVEMREILTIIRKKAEKRGITYKRSIKSWLREWKAHNFLVNYNVETSRTSSVDLNEDEKLIRRVCYFLLALLYKG